MMTSDVGSPGTEGEGSVGTPNTQVPAEFKRLHSWGQQLEDVTDDLLGIYLDRQRWSWLRDTALANDSIPGRQAFLGWIARLYGNSVSMAARRHVDVRADSLGLRRLLEEVGKSEISRDNYRNYHHWLDPSSERDLSDMIADASFASVAGSAELERLPAGCTASDIEKLEAVSKVMASYATVRLAHLGKAAPSGDLPTFGDLDSALDAFAEVISKYQAFLRSVGMTMEIGDNTDWKAVFSVPWFS